MWRAWLLLSSLLGSASVQAAASLPGTCPPDAEVRRVLRGELTTAPVACRMVDKEHDVALVAAIVPPRAGAAARVVVGLSAGGSLLRGQESLPRKPAQQKPKRADNKKIVVAPAGLTGADWFRVDVTASACKDLFVAQTMVSFFMTHQGKMRHLWTGLGDRHERRFDRCQLDTSATFQLLDSGALARDRRTTRVFRDPGGLDAGRLAKLNEACLAAAPAHDSFTVADDGVDSDVPISAPLRAAARENRLLSLRARTSPAALRSFILSSLSLVPRVRDQLMDAHTDVPNASITTTGASAYFLDSGGRTGLNWSGILAVVAPDGQPLARALAKLRNDDGAWVEARTDYGGCHQPESATEPLRDLVAAWQAAPPAFRDAFEPVLAADLEEMSTDDCVCAKATQRGELQRALDVNATIILPLPGGARAARALRAVPSSKTLNFDCSPG